MPDLILFPGGRNTEDFLFANSKQEKVGYPSQVAGEYGRGDFTLGVPFAPSLTTRQKTAVEEITSDTDYPSIMWVICCPEEHSTDSIAIRVQADITGACSNKPCCETAMDGLTFDVVYQTFDNETLEAEGDAEVVPNMAGLDAAAAATDGYLFAREDFVNHIPTGKSVMIGLRLLTPPTGGAERLGCLTGSITPIVKIHNYDQPIQVM